MKIDGLPVVDPHKKIKLHITKRDADTGQTKSPASCAAAKACIRQMGAKRAFVHISRTYIDIGGKWLRFHTPQALRTEIIAFDKGGRFEPGEYTLQPLQPSHRGGRRHGSNSTRKTGKKRARPHVVHGIRTRGGNY